jgi:hypothetical protein
MCLTAERAARSEERSLGQHTARVKRASHINIPENIERRQCGAVVKHGTIICATKRLDIRVWIPGPSWRYELLT